MAKATDPRPAPNYEIYDFEADFDRAFNGAIQASQLFTPLNQGDNTVVSSPFIATQFVCGEQVQRSYFVPGTSDATNQNRPWSYPNLWQGVLYVKIAVNRKSPDQKPSLSQLRGLVRWLMQEHQSNLSAHMKYLQIVQVMETGTSPSFDAEKELDSSAIAFKITFTFAVVNGVCKALPIPE